MAKPKLVARKTAEKLLYNLYANLYFSQKNALMTPNKTDAQQKYLTTLTSFLEIASASDFTNIVASLDNEGFLVYYDKVSELVKFFAPCLLESVRATRPIEFNMLDGAISQITDANLAADIIEGFSAREIARLPFTSKMKAMNTLMDTWFKGQNREREMVKVLNAITADERPTFLSAMVAGENAMLKKICDKTDGAENASVFVLFDNLLSQMGYTVRDKNGITITSDRPIEGSFNKGLIKLTTHASNGYIDKEFLVPAFTPVTFTYQKEKMTVPAFTFTDKNAFTDFVFESKYLETLDWSKLTEKQKDDYYFEFVMHYLPSGFLEQLGSPLQIIIGAIIGIFVAGLLAPLKVALIALDIGSMAYDIYQGVMIVIEAMEKRKTATSIRELKESAKLMASGVAKLTMQAVNAILSFASARKGRTSPDSPSISTNSRGENPRSILSDAGYTSEKILGDADTTSRLDSLRSTYSDEELTQLIAKGKEQKKGLSTIISILEKDISYRRLSTLKNSDVILKDYDAFFGSDSSFQNELVKRCSDPDILSSPKKLLKNYGDTFKDYFAYSKDVMNRTDITLERKITYLQEYYRALPAGDKNRVDALIPKGIEFFNPDGSINWPKFMGFDVDSLQGIDDLPKRWYRTGSPKYGSTYTDASHTNFELSLPNIDNPDAVHKGKIPAQNTKYYKELVDAIAANDPDSFKKCFRGDDVDAKATFIQARNEYSNYIKDVKKSFTSSKAEMTISTDSEMIHISIPNGKKQVDILYKYGLSGKVAEWRSVNGDIIGSGGPNQYSLPFTIDTLKDLCLTK